MSESDITEKTDSLCSNAESLKQCLTDLVTMVRTQAETIESLEKTNKKLIQQHDEEIEELTLKLTEKDKELSEVTVENTSLHSSIAHLRKCINNIDDELRIQCKSVMSLESTNSGLFKENSQLKLQLTKKDNELREVLVSNQILSKEVESQEKRIVIKNKLVDSYLGLVLAYDKIKELRDREREIGQLRLKLTETRQKLRDETKKYDELLKISRKAGVKAANDFSDQSTEESETMSCSSEEDSESQEDEVIEVINKKKIMNENPSSHSSAQEGRKALKRKGKKGGGPASKIGG